MHGGWLVGGVVCFGWGIHDMEVDRLVTPESRNKEVSIGDVKLLEVLKIIKAREIWLDDQSNTTVSIVGW